MPPESRKQFGEVVFATACPVSTHHPPQSPTLASSPENRSHGLLQAASACGCNLLMGEMGELGLVARLRRRLSLKRKVNGESFTNNGIVTKTLPRRFEGITC